MAETKVTSIRIDKEVWKEAKKQAINLDLPISKFIESAILHEIQRVSR